MNKDIVFIIMKLQWRYWMHKIKEKYHTEYDVFGDSCFIKNINEHFLFNYRDLSRRDGKFIYNLFKEDCIHVCQLPNNYF